mmetsp:Transcript_7173/g.15569  ORF Transcript_7173/g.15569 Transcript_7173/m.15569 type:complete len:86 (-) Transcript_7173:13-270(-)
MRNSVLARPKSPVCCKIFIYQSKEGEKKVLRLRLNSKTRIIECATCIVEGEKETKIMMGISSLQFILVSVRVFFRLCVVYLNMVN